MRNPHPQPPNALISRLRSALHEALLQNETLRARVLDLEAELVLLKDRLRELARRRGAWPLRKQPPRRAKRRVDYRI